MNILYSHNESNIYMQIELPRYDNISFPSPKNKPRINEVRIYLLRKEISKPTITPSVVAKIISKTISNNSGIKSIRSIRSSKGTNKLSINIRKGSDSSASSNYEPILPTKKVVADKKQQRWATKNGILSQYKVNESQSNDIQMRAARFLRKLSASFISSPKKYRSPNAIDSYTINQINKNLLQTFESSYSYGKPKLSANE